VVDAAAAAGTTVAALAPLLAERCGSWRVVYYVTAAALAIVSLGSLSLDNQNEEVKSAHQNHTTGKQTLPQTKPPRTTPGEQENGKDTSSKYPLKALLSPAAIATYFCHSADNFTKYSINAWASTMLVDKFGASLTVVGAILATQEAVGVASRLGVGVVSPSASFKRRGLTSCLAFAVQGIALLVAFQASTSLMAAVSLTVSAIAVGAHSVGFRPIYLEAAPDHAGSLSGLGNTIASLASAVGPALIGNVKGWHQVGVVLLLVNLGGAAAAMMIVRAGQNKHDNKTKKALSSSE
jgi:sugar phosphate permease